MNNQPNSDQIELNSSTSGDWFSPRWRADGHVPRGGKIEEYPRYVASPLGIPAQAALDFDQHGYPGGGHLPL